MISKSLFGQERVLKLQCPKGNLDNKFGLSWTLIGQSFCSFEGIDWSKKNALSNLPPASSFQLIYVHFDQLFLQGLKIIGHVFEKHVPLLSCRSIIGNLEKFDWLSISTPDNLPDLFLPALISSFSEFCNWLGPLAGFSGRCQSPGCPQRLPIRSGNGIRCLVVESILKGLYSTFIDVLTLTNKLIAFCMHSMIGRCRSFLRFDAKNDYFPE